MSDLQTAPIIRRASGITPSERYLNWLGEKSFLSLWSYPGIYRDQKTGGCGDGKEICDLIVLFGSHIIVFSDKHCAFPNTGNVELDWNRWFRRALLESAKQAWGAERWLRSNPHRIFLDRACTQRFPFSFPAANTARFHLVVVAHDVEKSCTEMFGGSGTLMIRTDLKGAAAHTVPFTIGDLDPQKSFVHVLDDAGLEIVLRTLDTISDFTSYLQKKEKLLRSTTNIFAAGEEELLAFYLGRLNQNGEHDFVFPEKVRNATGIMLMEGHWKQFEVSSQRRAQVQANQMSYVWDGLIERFSYYALKGQQFYSHPPGLSSTEIILRFMAQEPRTRRRMLGRRLIEMLETTPRQMRRVSVVLPSHPGDAHYVFLLLPVLNSHSEEDNRAVRRSFLEACCQITKLKCPDAEDIIGIATESGCSNEERSEDALYLDARRWTKELNDEALELQAKLRILVDPHETRFVEQEYPVGDLHMKIPTNPRNKPCPCGSNKKYKKCHGR